MVDNARREPRRPVGLRARLVRLLRSAFAAARDRRKAEDARDLARVEAILARNEPSIPHEEVKRRLGML
jgi:hypothetical protein